MPSEVTLEARRYASATDLAIRGGMNLLSIALWTSTKYRIDWIDILRSILMNTGTAVTTRLVVTSAIRVVSAANFSVRSLGLHN